jgi:Peptidase A4 family
MPNNPYHCKRGPDRVACSRPRPLVGFVKEGSGLSVKASLRGLVALALPVMASAALWASPASANATSSPVVGGPMQHLLAGTSSNWSGYASTDGPFSSVSASWVQPTGNCTTKSTYSAFWVGLDGDGTSTVEQTGSEVDCVAGVPQYDAWYEMYPAFAHNYANPVEPGDHFTAAVTASGSTFTLTIADLTAGWSHRTVKSLTTAKKHSAEVIAEAPCCTASGGILPLTDFGTVAFTSAKADGAALGNASPSLINMVAANGSVKAKTSALKNGEDFSVIWKHN